MQRSKIEWLNGGYSINPVKGLCPVACKDNQGKEYCFARRFYKRFKWNPEIRFEPKVLDEVLSIPNQSRIFVGSTMELFGDWVQPKWMFEILGLVKSEPWHTFIFLTKCPSNLSHWSPFPQNVYVGVSVTNQEQYDDAVKYLEVVDATVKFLSFEPLLSEIKLD